MKIHKGDKVKIISGKQKGTESVVEKVYKENNKILVENVNIVTKHAKPTANTAGGLLKVNRPINVEAIIDEKDGKYTNLILKRVITY